MRDHRSRMITAAKSHSKGEFDKARANAEILLQNPVGIGEHGDVMESLQEQLDIMANCHERIQILEEYFD